MSQWQHSIDDLLWVINSPPLVDAARPPVGRLSQSEIDANQLAAFLAERDSRRVGRYFEDLLHYFLLHHTSAHDVRRGLQVVEAGTTIGELDFIFGDADFNRVHLEAAVKFYLYLDEDNPTGSHYVGPNARDSLERKMRRLLDHQLGLSRHPAARSLLGDQSSSQPTQRFAWVCGRIFYHPTQGESTSLSNPTRQSELLSPNHLRGTWIRQSELDWLESHPAATACRILAKPYWLAGAPRDVELLSRNHLRDQLRTHFSAAEHPRMISLYAGEDDSFVEIDRVIVVSDPWPLQVDPGNR